MYARSEKHVQNKSGKRNENTVFLMKTEDRTPCCTYIHYHQKYVGSCFLLRTVNKSSSNYNGEFNC